MEGEGWTQGELAGKLYTSSTNVARWLNGRGEAISSTLWKELEPYLKPYLSADTSKPAIKATKELAERICSKMEAAKIYPKQLAKGFFEGNVRKTKKLLRGEQDWIPEDLAGVLVYLGMTTADLPLTPEERLLVDPSGGCGLCSRCPIVPQADAAKFDDPFHAAADTYIPVRNDGTAHFALIIETEVPARGLGKLSTVVFANRQPKPGFVVAARIGDRVVVGIYAEIGSANYVMQGESELVQLPPEHVKWVAVGVTAIVGL